MALLAGLAAAETEVRPAARVHVRYVEGVPMRHTSKLAHVVELNFTLGWDYTQAKQVIKLALKRIAAAYALGPDSAFTLRSYTGPANGSSIGLPDPMFTLAELEAADVIVTNDLGNLGGLQSRSPEGAAAFETAVRGGRSVLSFFGSGDSRDSPWRFYSEEFLPLEFDSWGGTHSVPVYRNHAERGHIVLQGVMEQGTVPMTVPMGIDSIGGEILEEDVPARNTRKIAARFALDPLTDARYAPSTTCLLRFDPRNLATDIFAGKYRFKGGNAYSFILEVGAGKSAYLSAGFDATDMTSGSASFDVGTGDFDRYIAQMLFFLAGYITEACGGSVECSGLPVVDARDRLTGETFGATSIRPDSREPGFAVPPGIPYRAELLDVRGRVLAARSGIGGDAWGFESEPLRPGLYFLRVRTAATPPHTTRFVVAPLP